MRASHMRLQRKAPGPFRYRHHGNLAALGCRSAIIEIGKQHLHVFVVWALRDVAHIFFLIGFRNRVIASLEWTWSYFSYRCGGRLITGKTGDERRSLETGQGRTDGGAGSA